MNVQCLNLFRHSVVHFTISYIRPSYISKALNDFFTTFGQLPKQCYFYFSFLLGTLNKVFEKGKSFATNWKLDVPRFYLHPQKFFFA